MDIISLLKKDHDLCRNILTKLKENQNLSTQKKKELYLQLRKELLAHSEAEDPVIYRAIEGLQGVRSQVLESREEHKLSGELLLELEDIDPTDGQWDAKIDVLNEMVTHHISEEEEGIFTALRKHFSADTRKELGKEFQEEKQRIASILEENTHIDFGAIPQSKSGRGNSARA